MQYWNIYCAQALLIIFMCEDQDGQTYLLHTPGVLMNARKPSLS